MTPAVRDVPLPPSDLLDWISPGDYGSQDAFQRLVEDLRNRKISAMIGAGLSANFQLPDWNTPIEELSKAIPNAEVRNSLGLIDDVVWRAQECRNRLTDSQFSTALANILDKPLVACPPVVRHLLELPLCHVFTMNYDDMLEKSHALLTGKKSPSFDWANPSQVRELLSNLGNPDYERRYVHLHGRFDSSSIVFSYRDYVREYFERNELPHRLFVIMATQRLLFVGFSFRDPDFVNIARQVTALGVTSLAMHYAVLPLLPEQKFRVERNRLKSMCHVDPIFFSSDNHGDFSRFSNLMRALHARVVAAETPPLRAREVHLARPTPPEVKSLADPQKGQWGGSALSNGRNLTATVMPTENHVFAVRLKVEPVNSAPPLTCLGRRRLR